MLDVSSVEFPLIGSVRFADVVDVWLTDVTVDVLLTEKSQCFCFRSDMAALDSWP